MAVTGAAILSLAGCSSQPEEEKSIPEGMSEAAYDMGTKVYDLAGSYVSGSDGYDTTAAAVQSAIDENGPNIDAENNKPDERVLMLCTMIAMELTTGDEDEYSQGNVENLRDALGYTLETGEYSEEYSMLETE